jgi:hypothetical protein
MHALIRPLDGWERKIFFLCVALSLSAHLAFVWIAVPSRGEPGREPSRATALAERFAKAVNAATDLDGRQKARLEAVLTRLDAARWSSGEFSQTLQWAANDLGFPVRDCDTVRALDPERSQEGRWDVRVWLDWGESREASDFLVLAFLTGEGTLKSDFGSHRLWVQLEAPDGTGRVAFETMDCRLYRAGKLAAADLLHRAAWVEP